MSRSNVVITGAGGGMGRAVVEVLAERDVNAICVDLDRRRVQDAIDRAGGGEGELFAHGADVGEATEVKAFIDQAVERWGGLDGVFNMVGIEGEVLRLGEATVDDFDTVMRINARSVFLTMNFAVPHLIERGGGTIVSTGSHLAIRGEPFLASYGASKHAIVGLSRTLAVEGAPHNVRANVVSPGSMDTRMIRELYPRISDDPAEAEALLISGIPHGRFAQPRELAETGVWLLLDAPAHLNGQVIHVDGARAAN